MKFDKINLEELTQDDERLKSSQAGFLDQFVPMPDGNGSTRLRILPPQSGRKLYQYNRVHSINGRKVHCPRPLVNGKWDRSVACPICDYYAHLWSKADKCADKHEAEKLQNEARMLKPSERYYYNAIVRTLVVNGKPEKNVGPRILSIGKDLHGKILKGILGDADERGLGDVTNLLRGYDYIIKKEMVGEYPRYSDSCFAREPSPAGTPEEIERWSTSLHDLGALRNPKPVAELEKELAIHRRLIPDTAGFDVAAFDSKFTVSNVEIGSETPVSTVEVGESEAPVASDVATFSEPEANDPSSLADDDFIQEIREMEDRT